MRRLFFCWTAVFLFRLLFRRVRPIIKAARGGRGHDGHLYRQRIRLERPHGLPAASGGGAAGRTAPAERTLSSGGALRRSLCGGGFSAGTGLSGGHAGEAGGGGSAGPDCLRRGGKTAAASAVVLRRLLRDGRLCAGTGASFRQRGAGGQRRVLYQRGRQGSGDCGGVGVRGAGGGFPGVGEAGGGGTAASGQSTPLWTDSGVYGSLGQRQRSSGRKRAGGSGCCARIPGPAVSLGSAAAPDAGSASEAGGPSGTPAASGSGTAAPPDALPVRRRRRAAAGGPDGLGGNQWNPLARTDGGAVSRGIGDGRCALGRRTGKGRSTWRS